MVKKAIILGLLFLTYFEVQSQYSITGKLVDEDSVAIAYAHVILFDVSSDNKELLKGEVTNEQGLFNINVDRSGPLYLEFQILGYENFRTENFIVQDNMDLGVVRMEQGSEQLEEVTVVGRIPLFEQKVDRTIVNVQGSVTNVGNNVLNILGKAPMVRVNRAGNEISMLGKQGVVVMVDGKQIRLEALDVMNLLSNISSDNIESIELITSPPSSFDAQGNAGIINIKTIRPVEGWSGQYSANAGIRRRTKYGGSFNLSYQKEKWYGYANLSANIANDYEEVFINTNSTVLETNSDLYSLRKPTTGLYNLEIGLEHSISPKTTVGGMFSALYSDWTMDSWSNTNSLIGSDPSNNQTISYEENRLFRTLYNVNLRHSLSDNAQLNLDYDFIKFKRKNPTNYEVLDLDEDTMAQFRSSATTPVTVHVLSADMEQTFSENMTLKYGLKGSFSDFENQVVVAYEEEGEFVNDPVFTDDYFMDENIYAAYTNFDYHLSQKLRLQTGIRYEYYSLALASENGGEVTSREQGYIFPSVFLTYSPSERKELSLSYVKRIQRPGFLVLAPYFYFFDERTLFTGNPSIVPSRSNQLQLNYSFGQLITNLQYSWETDPILGDQPTLDLTRELLIVRPILGIRKNTLTLNMSHPFEITNWWNGHFNVLGTRLYQLIDNYGLNFKKTSYNFESNLVQNWKVNETIDVEMTANYSSPYYFGVMKMKPRSQVDLGIK